VQIVFQGISKLFRQQ